MIDKNKKLIILMPPKTASNSIRVLLEESGFRFHTYDNIGHPSIHLKLSEIVKLNDITNLNSYKIIQITRNPYIRFVSSFFFQKKILPQKYEPIFKYYNLEQFTEHLSNSKNSEDFIKSFYGDTSFVYNSITNGINWGGSRLYDAQVSWNDLNQNIIYFRLEDIVKDLTPLKEFLRLGSSILPNINSQQLELDYMSLIDSKSLDIISNMFDIDFKTLGYDTKDM